ncbi:MAG: acyl-CoA dehydrogenase, partial [Pseudomonadota bacterium]|nr:acyl-CoA dehydrogenase [Pseudomonadota bacterium]
VAPVPFASTIYLAAEAVQAAGSEQQKREYLPRIARGELIATLALAEGPGEPSFELGRGGMQTGARATDADKGRLSGSKWPVPDGSIAELAVVAARETAGVSLFLVDLGHGTVRRETLKTVDPTRDHAKLVFDDVPATRLGQPGQGAPILARVLDRAAVLFAFEQVGGASACLEAATSYAKERFAFGRPIGSFQAIKHNLADMYVALELARSNAYYGAWALGADAAELPLAAATARVSASKAFSFAAEENIQTHGGIGFTWDMDCHLFYRRAKLLALTIGSPRHWKHRVVSGLETRNAA